MEAPFRAEEKSDFAGAAAFVAMKYPQYSLRHIFYFSFKQGGLTRGQFEHLYSYAQECRREEFELSAKANGFEIKYEPNHAKNVTDNTDEFAGCVVGDPKSSAHLTPEQKKRWAEKAKSQTLAFFNFSNRAAT